MNAFLDDCGATGPLNWAIERRGSAKVERFTREQPYLIIGRDERANLRLDHPEISERHAYLQLVGGRLYFQDLGSTSGVYRNGLCLRSGRVGRGESLRVGPYRIRLEAGDHDEYAPRQEKGVEHAAPPAPPLRLELAHRGLSRTSTELAAPLVWLGRSRGCEGWLNDPSVPSHGCALIRTDEGAWLVDLLVPGGVQINGTLIERGTPLLIKAGDTITIGSSHVTLTTSLNPSETVDSSELTEDKGNGPESLPLPNRVQTQLLEQIQTTLHDRFQDMLDLQYEQFDAIREELEQVRELRRDLDELRANLYQAAGPSAGFERMDSGGAPQSRLGAATPIEPEEESSEGSPVLRLTH